MNDDPSAALAPMLRKLRLWAPLDADDERALLALPHSIVAIQKQRALVTEGDPVTHCWVILSGYCVRYKIVGDGGRQILSIHMKGDLVDLQNALLGVADHGVQALTECQMAKIPIEAIRQLSDTRPTIKDALWYDTLVDGSIFREWVANVGRRDGQTRVAHLLCEFALKLEAVSLGERLDYELPMTQDQLADATGMTPVHVNRVLQALAREDLIERVTPKSVLIGIGKGSPPPGTSTGLTFTWMRRSARRGVAESVAFGKFGMVTVKRRTKLKNVVAVDNPRVGRPLGH